MLVSSIRRERQVCGTHDAGRFHLVLRPLRAHPPTGLGSLVAQRANGAPGHLHPAEFVARQVFAYNLHLVGWVLVPKVP